MPAYFEMSLQFRREDLYPGFIPDFDAALDRAGVKFDSGCWEDRGLSQGEITAWNQKKLDQDFELHDDFLEWGSNAGDYKQSFYHFENYTKVRGFWINRYPSRDEFSFTLIIPEGEIFRWVPGDKQGEELFQKGLPAGFYQPVIRAEAAEKLLTLSQTLWQFPAVRTVQTMMELSDAATSLEDLRAGSLPTACPFAILEPGLPAFPELSAKTLTEGRPGLLLLEIDMLPPDFPG